MIFCIGGNIESLIVFLVKQRLIPGFLGELQNTVNERKKKKCEKNNI